MCVGRVDSVCVGRVCIVSPMRLLTGPSARLRMMF